VSAADPSFPFSSSLLSGRKALVSGGGTGLGRAIAEGLARAGAHVVIAARREEILKPAAEELSVATGATVEYDLVDIRNGEYVEALAGRHSDVDILVNNAGGQFPQKARDYSPNGWRSVIDLNLNGTWNMTQVFGDQMLSGDGGTICQITAPVGRGIPGIAHSASARAAVSELTRTLAFEWGPKVRLNCVAPGAFRTSGWEETYDAEVGSDMSGVPLPYPGRTNDIANAVVFVVSPASAYVTGQVLHVDGGQGLHGTMSALPSDGYPEREQPPFMK